jgi:hypothetical protein
MGKSVKPGSGDSAGRVNWTEGAAGRIHGVVGISTFPAPSNPNKPPSGGPPVHAWQNGSYDPVTGYGARVQGGYDGTKNAQLPGDAGTRALDKYRSAMKCPTKEGQEPQT